MRFRDYDKYGSALPLPAHLFRMLKWKIASVFGKDHRCIHCLGIPCIGENCFESIRRHLISKKLFPKPDGFLAWDFSYLQKGLFWEVHKNPLSNRIIDYDLLKILRDGRSGGMLQEYCFNGKKNPLSGRKIASDGSSTPADCWDELDPTTTYEVKSITSSNKATLTLKSSNETGSNRRRTRSVSETIQSYDYWIFVDRTQLYYSPEVSLPYFFVSADELEDAISGTYTSMITKRQRRYVDSELQVGKYETAMRIIWRCQQSRD